jgi:CubicO group peptidase (beta-lactamase class C family)
MMRRFLLFAAAALAAAAQNRAGNTLDAEHLKLIRPRLEELVKSEAIPGAVALVASHGEVVSLVTAGWRDVENRKPMTADSIFQIMSMTKNFTGVAVMMLVEQGKIELRRPVEDYLPEFRGQMLEERLPNGNTMLRAPSVKPAVWHLMSHTSGLGGDPEGELRDNPRTMRVPLAEAVRFYGHQRLGFDPGTRWRYSNMGIAALGRIVEVVSGEDYVAFVENHILKPLGMKDTFFFPPEDKKDRIAMVYKHAGGKLVRSGEEILAGDPAKYRAGAKYPAPEFGLYSTAPDLLKFYRMLLEGGALDGRRYLSRQSIATMTRVFTPAVTPSGWLGGTGYGLTFEIVDKPEGTLLLHSPGAFGHGGAFGTEGWMDPATGLIRICMVQLSDGTGPTVRSVVMQISAAALDR